MNYGFYVFDAGIGLFVRFRLKVSSFARRFDLGFALVSRRERVNGFIFEFMKGEDLDLLPSATAVIVTVLPVIYWPACMAASNKSNHN